MKTKLQRSVADRFADLGFEDIATGGGCNAYSLDLGDGDNILVTDGGGAQLPTSEDENITVGIYVDGGYITSFGCKCKLITREKIVFDSLVKKTTNV